MSTCEKLVQYSAQIVDEDISLNNISCSNLLLMNERQDTQILITQVEANK